MTVDNHEQPAKVTIERVNGQWVVHFTVNGKVTQRLFDLEVHAKSFAAGQRMRLGLPDVPDESVKPKRAAQSTGQGGQR